MPKTTRRSEHSPGNHALSRTRPILQPHATYVVGHRAKDEHSERVAAVRRERRLRSPPPHRSAASSDHRSHQDPGRTDQRWAAVRCTSDRTRRGGPHAAVTAARASHGKGSRFEKPSTVYGQALSAVHAPPGPASLWRQRHHPRQRCRTIPTPRAQHSRLAAARARSAACSACQVGRQLSDFGCSLTQSTIRLRAWFPNLADGMFGPATDRICLESARSGS